MTRRETGLHQTAREPSWRTSCWDAHQKQERYICAVIWSSSLTTWQRSRCSCAISLAKINFMCCPIFGHLEPFLVLFDDIFFLVLLKWLLWLWCSESRSHSSGVRVVVGTMYRTSEKTFWMLIMQVSQTLLDGSVDNRPHHRFSLFLTRKH